MSKPGSFILTILGMKHTGKSTLAESMIRVSPPPVFVLDPMGEYKGQSFRTVGGFIEAARSQKLKDSVFSFRVGSDQEARRVFKLARASGGTLVVEEAHIHCTPSQIDPTLSKAIFYSAHVGLNLIFVTQRAASVHNNLLSQSDAVISFKQTLDADVKRLKDLSNNPDEVRDLSQGQYKVYGELPDQLAPAVG